jgi:hypothetical protein
VWLGGTKLFFNRIPGTGIDVNQRIRAPAEAKNSFVDAVSLSFTAFPELDVVRVPNLHMASLTLHLLPVPTTGPPSA